MCLRAPPAKVAAWHHKQSLRRHPWKASCGGDSSCALACRFVSWPIAFSWKHASRPLNQVVVGDCLCIASEQRPKIDPISPSCRHIYHLESGTIVTWAPLRLDAPFGSVSSSRAAVLCNHTAIDGSIRDQSSSIITSNLSSNISRVRLRWRHRRALYYFCAHLLLRGVRQRAQRRQANHHPPIPN